MRRTVLVVMIAVAVFLAGGMAAAAEPEFVVYYGTARDDVARGSADKNEMYGYQGSDELYGGLNRDKVYGGADGDRLFGGGDDDFEVDGGEGNDVANGEGGDDVVRGGSGQDKVSGELGADTLEGGTGPDEVYGGVGQDGLRGDIGDDTLSGNDGDDTLNGNDGDDTISGGADNDRLFGGAGENGVQTSDGPGNDTIDGDAGNDWVVGGLGADTLRGGDGNDKLVEGPWKDKAVDRLYAGDGDDFVNSANDPGARDAVDCGPGIDTVQADDADTVSDDCEKVEVLQDAIRRAAAIENRDVTAQDTGSGDFYDCLVPGYYRIFASETTCDVVPSVDEFQGVTVGVIDTEGDRNVGIEGAIETGLIVDTITLNPGVGEQVLWENAPFRGYYYYGQDTPVELRGVARSWSNTVIYSGYWTVYDVAF